MANIKNISTARAGSAPLRINLNAKAWRRLRETYADQEVPGLIRLQNHLSGLWLSALEQMAYSLSAPNELPDLVFIIGHWRSGTTFLHELLCLNPGFHFPSTYACMNPHVFPITEKAMLQHAGQQATSRPMDKMPISLASPQEDEFALLSLGVQSPYDGLLFPGAMERGMAAADPEDLPEQERLEWSAIFGKFVSRVAAVKPGCPLILKSPTHSYRVSLLSKLYPGARFVHIVRNPFEVYSSTINMWKKLTSLYALTELPEEAEIARQVLTNWRLMEEKLSVSLPGLAEGGYVRVHYEKLASQPLEEIQRIYETLGLKGLPESLPLMENYLASRAHFERNRFELSAESAAEVGRVWAEIFEKYGYTATSA